MATTQSFDAGDAGVKMNLTPEAVVKRHGAALARRSGWEAHWAQIPPDMWDLLKLGLGGYVLGRSAEKGVKAWKK